MIIRKTNSLTAFVFLAAVLLHILVIVIVFLRFPANTPQVMQTQFVMQHIPQPPALPATPRTPQKPQQRQKPAVKPSAPVTEEAVVTQEKQPELATTATTTSEVVPVADTGLDTAEMTQSMVGSESESTDYGIDFQSLILQRIAEKKIYPKAARKRNQEGSVTLNIIVLKSGQLAQAEIITPCRHTFLNEAALATVRAAAPFPLGETAPDHIELTVTLEYRLEG